MVLKHLGLNNFRSYIEREFEFSPDVTVITGRNGAGKTNILEAIYTLLRGRPFRDSDEELLHHGADWWKITGIFDDHERELRYRAGQPNPKQLRIDEVVKGRFTYTQQRPVVLFEPDDLALIHGSPSLRRSYLDTLLCSLYSNYRSSLSKYERALLQRNNLLKRGGDLHHLRDRVFVWDIALSEYGAVLQDARRQLVKLLNQQLGDTYSMLAKEAHELLLTYSPAVDDSHGLARLLSRSLEQDAARGFTSVGPHRDDISFTLNTKDAKTTASRGEVRTIVLSLKYAELQLLSDAYPTTPPLLLLDDVFSELDTTRQTALMASTSGVQKIITTTHPLQAAGIDTIQL